MPRKKAPTAKSAATQHAPKAPRAAELLASYFRNLIIRGELKDGDRLPGEKELVAQFGVARTTLREALVILQSDGLISVSRGARKGALVHRPTIQAAARQMNFLMQSKNVTMDDVYGTLCAVEPAAIRALALKAGKSDITALRTQIRAMRDVIGDDHAFTEATTRFHREVIERSGLTSLALIVELIATLVEAYMETTARAMPRTENRAGKLKSIQTREKLVELIEKRDSDGAEALWRNFRDATRELNMRWQPRKVVQDYFALRPMPGTGSAKRPAS